MFKKEGTIYRQVNLSYQAEYEMLMQSGLYEQLTKSGAMIPHQEVMIDLAPRPDIAYIVIQPEPIGFVSYPYEWCFSQLKEAATLTLALAKRALAYGMSLKDASAYNVQFHNGRAVFIDTLSFEVFREGEPWVAYRQFCQHFLAPLALMVYRDVRLNQLLRMNLDGIPLDIASLLLPFKTRLNFGLATHLHLHAKSQKKYAGKQIDGNMAKTEISKNAFIGLLESLITTVRNLRLPKVSTEWTDYYQDTNYSAAAFDSKKDVIKVFLSQVNPKSVWDLGANTGEFSRIASNLGLMTVAFDIDPGAVIENYRLVKADKEKHIIPLIMDLTNPSPALGWHHQERQSLIERGPVDMAMALALIHHLAIGNNVPLRSVASFFADLCHYLIVEFIPKSDSQVRRLLASREDIFPDYTRVGFETAFNPYFKIIDQQQVEGSERILYLMETVQNT
jgi:hypothetical protein